LTKQKRPAKKKVDEFLMSDDSIEEAFRSLPDDSWRSEKPAKPADDITIFHEPSPKKRKEDVLPSELPVDDSPNCSSDDAVEVPASSPVQHGPTKGYNDGHPASMTPLGELLKGFSYDTAQPRTRVVYGLPTPASSVQQTATPKSSSPTDTQISMPTPLQRIGVRALRRGQSQSMPATPPASNSSKQLDSLPVNPAFIPLPKVDVEEVEALNMSLGSEDLLIPESDSEDGGVGGVDDGPTPFSGVGRLNLSKFLYS
jgi:exonuclease-1